MQRFAALYDALDSTTSTNQKVAAMEAYFGEAPPRDAAWAVFFLISALCCGALAAGVREPVSRGT